MDRLVSRDDLNRYVVSNRDGGRHRYREHADARKGIVKLRQISGIFRRARPAPRPQINRLAVVLGGENAKHLPKLTIP